MNENQPHSNTSVVPSVKDLPLGTVAELAPYNQQLVRGIETTQAGQVLEESVLVQLEEARENLWDELGAEKARSMVDYAKRAAKAYGFSLDSRGALEFPFQETDHHRVGYESHFYRSDPETRTLVPASIDHARKRVIVFATGRAFAEQNARLNHLTTNEALRNARNVMSAQVYLTGSRLVTDYPGTATQVVAVAYDMVASEEETPAMRIQSIVKPQFMHPVSVMAAERIFGAMITDAGSYPNGTLHRSAGKIRGNPLPEDQIIQNLSGLVLVGGSVGCCVVHQVVRWLEEMLIDLGLSKAACVDALKSILTIHLGPTTVLPAQEHCNRLSVVGKYDEFVFAGNHTTPIVSCSDRSGSVLVSDPLARNSFHVVLDVPATIYQDSEGRRFDPIGTHFGHSMKHYTNGLNSLGFKGVMDAVLNYEGPYSLATVIEELHKTGQLDKRVRPGVADANG
ncbi:MAG: hypothetical protein CMJ75_03765 [Planctomycetaceae bacterium]|nr:hypothetical protein [Planctomycetaceae bacterium]